MIDIVTRNADGSVNCTICAGKGHTMRHIFLKFSVTGPDYQGNTVQAGEYGYTPDERPDPCVWCKSRGTFPALDEPAMLAILDACTVSKGKTKGRIKASRPKHGITVEAKRAYYVWRLARFHGGVDCTLPMMADLDVRGDGERPKLEALSRLLAAKAFGSADIGTDRWRQAIYG
jgi:hypothetical protein